MRAGASTEPLRVPLAEPTADAPAGSASGDDAHDDAPSTSGRPPSSPSGGLRGILRALRDPSCGPRLRRLLLFTSLREFKPSEPFLVELYETRGLTRGALTNDVFPAWTHARLPALILVCAFAARLGCRRAVILGTVSGMVTVLMSVSFFLFAASKANAKAENEAAAEDDLDEKALYVFGVPALAWVTASQAFAAFAFASHQAFLGIAFSSPSSSESSSSSRGTPYEQTYERIGTHPRYPTRREDARARKRREARAFPATSHGVKAATLASTCVSAVVGQALVRAGAPLVSLLTVTFLTQTGSLIVAGSFEREEESFERDDDENLARDLGAYAEASNVQRVTEESSGRTRSRSGDARFFAILASSFRFSRLIVSDPLCAAWSLWSVAAAPTHAFVAANWQTLVTEAGGDEYKHSAFAFGAWLAFQRAAAFLATLFVGAFAYSALVTSSPREEEEVTSETSETSASVCASSASRAGRNTSSPLAATLAAGSASLGLSAFFMLGASFARRETGVAFFVTLFVCVFEATSSVCAAAVGLGAGRVENVRAKESEESARDASFCGVSARNSRATSLAFTFASLSASGYLVDVGTQGITDLLSLDVRKRFETRAAFAAFASAAFLVTIVVRFFKAHRRRRIRVRADVSEVFEDDATTSLIAVEDL